MATNYPATADDGTSLPNPTGSSTQNSPDHASLHSNANDAIKALEAKLGTTASVPANNKLLVGTGAGTSTWTKDAPTGTIVGTTDSQTLTNKILTSPTINSPTITNATLTTDAVTGYTVSTTGTIFGISVASSQFSASALTDGTVTPAKLATGAGSSWAWQSYTPTMTNVTTGNGTLTAKYIQTGKNITGYVKLVWGSTTAFTGGVSFSLPVATSSNYSTSYSAVIGACQYYDASAGPALYHGSISWLTSTTCEPETLNAAGTYLAINAVTSTVPFTWTTSDIFYASFTYEAA